MESRQIVHCHVRVLDPKRVLFWQNIIMYEYLPAFLGDTVQPYKGYRPDVHPGISHVFQSAAFR